MLSSSTSLLTIKSSSCLQSFPHIRDLPPSHPALMRLLWLAMKCLLGEIRFKQKLKEYHTIWSLRVENRLEHNQNGFRKALADHVHYLLRRNIHLQTKTPCSPNRLVPAAVLFKSNSVEQMIHSLSQLYSTEPLSIRLSIRISDNRIG